MPLLFAGNPDDWLVYDVTPQLSGNLPVFLKRLPTRDSAEMWMVSHG